MDILPNKSNGDSTLTRVRRRRPSKMHILRVSLLVMLMTMMIVGGAVFSNLFASAAHAASHAGSAMATRMMPHAALPTPPDFSISKIHSPTTTIPLGGTVTWTLTATNSSAAGPAVNTPTAPNYIEIDDQLPFGIATATVTPVVPTDWACTGPGGSVITFRSFFCIYTGAYPINPGVSLSSINITATFSTTAAAVPTTATNSADIVTLYDTNTANNGVVDSVTTAGIAGAVPPDIRINKSHTGGNTFLVGQSITYSLSATDVGPFNFTGGQIRDFLPPGLTGVTVTPAVATDWSCVTSTLNVSITLVTCTYTGAAITTGNTTSAIAVTGTFNAAPTTYEYAPNYTDTGNLFSSDNGGTGSANSNLADAVTSNTVQVVSPVHPAISLSKTGSITGNTVTYTLTPSIVGTGTIPAGTVITITDAIPPQIALSPAPTITSTTVGGLTFAPLTLNGNLLTTSITAPAGGLAPGAFLPVITIVAQLASGVAPCSLIQNEATVSASSTSATFLPVVVSNTLQVPGTACGGAPSGTIPAALSLNKTGVRHGGLISYTLLPSIVGNSGSIPAGTVITLTDTLPAQVALVPTSVVQSANTPLAWTINISGNTITATLTAPTPGGIATGTLLPAIAFDTVIRPATKAGTIIENEATISAPGFASVSASSAIEVGEQHLQHPPHINCDDNCHENQCAHVAGHDCDHNGNKDAKDHGASKDAKDHSASHSSSDSKGNSSNSGSHSGSSNSSSSSASHHAIMAGGL